MGGSWSNRELTIVYYGHFMVTSIKRAGSHVCCGLYPDGMCACSSSEERLECTARQSHG